MVEDIILRGEFLLEDLRNNIIVKDNFNTNIVRCWQDVTLECAKLGHPDYEYIYDIFNKEDLIECISNGMSCEDIAYVVNQYRTNDKNYTQFFTYCNNKFMYGLHIFTKEDIINKIEYSIESIAYNVLKYPYKNPYGDLYREFVVPMIDGQIK